jgi:hypothetical protein
MTLKTQMDIGLLRVTIDAGVSIEVYQQRRLVRLTSGSLAICSPLSRSTSAQCG